MKGIAAKLILVMDECRYAQKDGKNKFHGYSYVSAANILEKVNEACVSHHVASVPSYEILGTEQKETAKGAKESLVTVRCELTIIDADSGETVVARSLGTGQDAGDKAVAKAQTMALKYAWMSTLNMSTGDDPEKDPTTDGQNTDTPSEPTPATQTQQTAPVKTTQQAPVDNSRKPIGTFQIKAIETASKRKGVDYLTYLGEYGCTTCEELTYQQAIALINKLNSLTDAK
jgi:hypothetical protein